MTIKNIASIEVTSTSATSYGVTDGIDVDFTVTFDDGSSLDGEATIAPDKINGGMSVYGDSPDMWLSGNVLSVVDRDGIRAIRDAVEVAV